MSTTNTKPPKLNDLRVWWNPQIGQCKAFHVPVKTPEEAALLLTALADYDLFQLANNIKPDYANAGGLNRYETDGEGGFDWFEWNDECGHDIDHLISNAQEA